MRTIYKILKKILNIKFTLMIVPTSESRVVNINFYFSYVILTIGLITSISILTVYLYLANTNKQISLNNKNNELENTLNKLNEFIEYIPQLDKYSKNIHKSLKTLNTLVSKTNLIELQEQKFDKQQVNVFNISQDIKDRNTKLKSIQILQTIYKNFYIASHNLSTFTKYLRAFKGTFDYIPSIYPLKETSLGKIYTSSFGYRTDPFTRRITKHNGIDLFNYPNTPVVASADGIVLKSEYNNANGNYVTLKHKYGFTTLYLHMSRLRVSEGDKIKKGQVIGYLGNTGRSSGHHLHYEVRINNTPVDPINFITLFIKADIFK